MFNISYVFIFFINAESQPTQLLYCIFLGFWGFGENLKFDSFSEINFIVIDIFIYVDCFFS